METIDIYKKMIAELEDLEENDDIENNLWTSAPRYNFRGYEL